MTLARLALCFLLGAVLGTAYDAIHVYGDVLSYHHPGPGETAWWVIPEFGLVGVAAGLAVPALERAVGPPAPPRPRPARIAAELALFALLYLATALVPAEAAPLLAAALLAVVAARLVLAPERGDWAFALTAAVLGPLGEALLIAAGLFAYADPDVVGIPLWLPALWANGGLMIRRVLAPLATPAAARAASPSAGPAGARAGAPARPR